MPRDEFSEYITPSVFDRLAYPDVASKAALHGYTIAQMEEAVRNDLLDLLNTHRPPDGTFKGNPDVERSIVNYGIKDLAHLEVLSSTERDEMRAHVKKVIEIYEPRLCDVEVFLRESGEVEVEQGNNFNKAAVYFRINAKLNIRPNPVEGISFVTMLELTNGRHEIFKG